LERRIVEDEGRTLAEWEELYRRRRTSERPGRDTDSLLQSLGGLEGMVRMLANPSNTASRSNRKGRAKGYAPWSPRTHTRELIDNVREVLSEYEILLPLTIRQVFYRLVGVYGYPKDENAYERLCNALNRARRARMIGFEDLRDDGISVMKGRHYDGEEGFYAHVRNLAEGYETDKLARQDVDIRVYCEAAGMMPQLHRTCAPYSVPVYSCSGFDSLTAKHDLARRCAETFTYRGKPTVILHLGDLDPLGVSIYESMREDVLAFVAEDAPQAAPEDVAVFERVALQPKHIGLYQLTIYPPKPTDLRSGRWEGGTCQLEALPPDVLAEQLDQAIRRHLDGAVLEEDREAEVAARRNIARALPAAEG
jgi:hypothetical protein